MACKQGIGVIWTVSETPWAAAHFDKPTGGQNALSFSPPLLSLRVPIRFDEAVYRHMARGVI